MRLFIRVCFNPCQWTLTGNRIFQGQIFSLFFEMNYCRRGKERAILPIDVIGQENGLDDEGFNGQFYLPLTRTE